MFFFHFFLSFFLSSRPCSVMVSCCHCCSFFHVKFRCVFGSSSVIVCVHGMCMIKFDVSCVTQVGLLYGIQRDRMSEWECTMHVCHLRYLSINNKMSRITRSLRFVQRYVCVCCCCCGCCCCCCILFRVPVSRRSIKWVERMKRRWRVWKTEYEYNNNSNKIEWKNQNVDGVEFWVMENHIQRHQNANEITWFINFGVDFIPLSAFLLHTLSTLIRLFFCFVTWFDN